MLDPNQRLRFLDQLGIPAEGRRITLNAIKFSPVRKVSSKGGGNVPSIFQSHKMQREIRTESHRIEFFAGVGYELDPEVLEFYPQPCRLKFEVIDPDGEIHQIDHTPDFMVMRTDGIFLVEWKSESALQSLARKRPWRFKQTPDGTWYSPLIEQWLAQRGIRYLVCSDQQIPRQRMENLTFLEEYFHPAAEDCPIDAALRIQSALKEEPYLFLSELYEKANCRPDDAFKLMADGDLIGEIDSRPLNDPRHFRVFRDEAVRAFEYARRRPMEQAGEMGVVEIRSGARLRYDQQPYQVSLVGQQTVLLKSDTGDTVELDLKNIEALIANGHLKSDGDGIINTRSQSLSNYSQDDLRIAVERRVTLDNIKATNRTQRRHLRAVAMAKLAGTDELVALVPRTKNRGNRTPRLTQDQLDLIQRVINEEYLTHRAPTMVACFKELETLCAELDIPAPSYPTLCEHIKALPQVQADLARHGKRVAYQNKEFVPFLHTDTAIHGVRPFQLVHMDHTTLDIELISMRTGKNLGRPTLSLATDAYTRRVLGIYLSFDKPSYRSNMMLLRDIVRRYGRLPYMIVVDNGKEFHSENFTLFARLYGIHIRYRPPANPRHGAVLERTFGTLNKAYIHNLAGNTKILRNVRQATGKFLPSRLAEWDLEHMYYGIQHWAFEYYDQEPHSALGMSPRDAFERGMAQSGERSHRIVRLTEDFLILTCPLADRTGTRVVDRQRGIKLHERFYYWCPEMTSAQVVGKKVPVRIDPWNAATVYVQINKKWVPAVCRTLASMTRMTGEELEALTDEYTARFPKQKHNELSLQRLVEFRRTFSPEGVKQLVWEQQEENRNLYEGLGLAAIASDPAPLPDGRTKALHMPSAAAPAEPVSQDQGSDATDTPLADDSDFDTF